MEKFIYFFSFSEPIIRNVLIGTFLLAVTSSTIGCFTFLRKRALVGDAVAHAVLPGICISFLLYQEKNIFILLIGAFITGWLSLVAIDFITSKSKLSEDTAIGLILSVFFGIGTLLLSYIQHRHDLTEKAGLEHFLFGNAIAINQQDLIAFSIITILMLITVALFYKEFILISFDENYGKTLGFPVKMIQLVLTTLTVLAVVIGVQAVGVILMSAMLVTPAATARFWTQKLSVFLGLACLVGVISSLSGAYISYISPSPTGPWIVMILSLLAILSFLFAPEKGIISKLLKQKAFQLKILEENILKAFYQLGEKEHNFSFQLSMDELIKKRPMEKNNLAKGLNRLTNQGFLEKENNKWALSPEGKNKGQRIVKLHRLWEVYLTKYVQIAPDHVHEDAESIEHIITPELERRLEELLNFPLTDPHNAEIPYKK